MDFTELYAQKKMTAAQAAALVKSGDWVDSVSYTHLRAHETD